MRPVFGILLVAVLAAPPAAAQDAPIVSLAPGDPARWDVAGYAGWRGTNKSDVAPEWDEWYDTASFGASTGYYWNPHVKLELDLSTTTEGGVFVQEQVAPPDVPVPLPSPFFRYGEHRFRNTTLSGGLVYQFAENTWFHPFVGGGVETVRERARLELEEQVFCVRVPCTPVRLPVQTSVSYRALPFASAGFKWYMTERAFIRSDIRSTFSSANVVDAVTWRIGIGADF